MAQLAEARRHKTSESGWSGQVLAIDLPIVERIAAIASQNDVARNRLVDTGKGSTSLVCEAVDGTEKRIKEGVASIHYRNGQQKNEESNRSGSTTLQTGLLVGGSDVVTAGHHSSITGRATPTLIR